MSKVLFSNMAFGSEGLDPKSHSGFDVRNLVVLSHQCFHRFLRRAVGLRIASSALLQSRFHGLFREWQRIQCSVWKGGCVAAAFPFRRWIVVACLSERQLVRRRRDGSERRQGRSAMCASNWKPDTHCETWPQFPHV